MSNKIKSQLQEKEFAVLKDKHRVLLKWATGCGKSKMAIDLVNHAVSTIDKKLVKVLFVVAERAHIKNWQEEFDKWNLNIKKVSTDVCCYASLKNYKDYHYDIVVLDEAHHCFSEKRIAALEELKENLYPNAYIYLLSATLSFNNQYRAEEIFGKFATSTVTLKKAIQKDILADPKIYIVALELDDSKVNQEILVNKADSNSPKVSWEDRMKYLTKKKPCIIQCTEKQKYIYYTNTMEYWKQRYERSKNQFQRNLWVNTGSKRKRFLGELKTGAVEQLLNIIPSNMKTVCFCTTISQAESFSANKTLSSKKSSKWNQAIIEDFNRGLIKKIYAIGMITEGMNLNGIKVGIITQLDGTERLFIQKQGRVMRSEDPVSFIFYYKNTQDENYLKKALENVDTKYIQYVNINQLKTIKL